MELAQDGKVKSVTEYKVLEDQQQKSCSAHGAATVPQDLQILLEHDWWDEGSVSGGVNWESLPRARQHGGLGFVSTRGVWLEMLFHPALGPPPCSS